MHFYVIVFCEQMIPVGPIWLIAEVQVKLALLRWHYVIAFMLWQEGGG